VKVKVQYDETSQPVYEGVAKNTYTKGPLFVVYVNKDKVYKYPLEKVWRVTESY
jgi:hypothetical protein